MQSDRVHRCALDLKASVAKRLSARQPPVPADASLAQVRERSDHSTRVTPSRVAAAMPIHKDARSWPVLRLEDMRLPE